ncbi:MAG: adenosine kinase [Alphaproteobacteria bacterium]|nr:adenosine kinase [Alphaproteobacteria bacterium]
MVDTVYDIVGIGNAIVDVLAKVGDTFLTERNLPKGSMTLLEAKEAGKIYAEVISEREVSGGSAANTVAGLASLGADCAFIGKVHDDELGQLFQRDIGAAGIDFFTEALTEGPATGRSVVLVTPDAQRSMFTYLGASRKLSLADIDEKIISESRITFIEGYLWDEPSEHEAILKACELAHKHGREVAFSVSDTYCVKQHRDNMLKLIKEHVNILFANEEELKTLFQTDDFYAALDEIKPLVNIAAVTRDSRGSVIVHGREKIFVEAEKIEDVVDSTGAGDLYASGFLYGLVKGRSLGTCAIIGNIAASEVISHYGARPEISLRGLVRKKLMEYGKRPSI